MIDTKVSAIITTHNRSELLKRAIEGVLNQTHDDVECIVVDDASTDDTEQVCQSYESIKYVRIPNEESRGGNYARNIGIKNSTGEFIAFLDDDDYWLPTKIEKQLALIQEKNCGLVFCPIRKEIVNPDNSITMQDGKPGIADGGDVSKEILFNIITTTSCIMVRKSLLLEVGCFDENLTHWQEYDLQIRLAQKTPFYFVNECLTVYRVDTRDTGRLTNNFNCWQKAVRYLRFKHKTLYQQLNWVEHIRVRRVYDDDALLRAINGKLKWRQIYHRYILLAEISILKLVK